MRGLDVQYSALTDDDVAPEQTSAAELSRLALLAAQVLVTPVAVVSLVEGQEQSVPVRIGLKRSSRLRPSGCRMGVERHPVDLVRLTGRVVADCQYDLAHVTERLCRGANVAGTVSRSGIGLAAARQIVEGHDGSPMVGSIESRGTTVTVRLPPAAPRRDG